MPARSDFDFGGSLISPGTRRVVNLPVSVLSDHTPVTLSAQIIHGKRPGPTVFVTAGVHGDEVIGVEISRRLLAMPNLDTLRGTLIVVPIVNSYGFLLHSRYLPDRRDLNRCFPGTSAGSLAARLANLLMEQVITRCDFGIDLHSAAAHRTNLPQVRISPGNPELLRLAQVFGAPVILTSKLRDGSLRMAARDANVNVLLYEAGEGLRFEEMSVRAGVHGILRVLSDLGMLSSKGVTKARRAPIFCAASTWLRAPQGGLLRTYKSEGDVVAKGDLLAVVSDPFGEVQTEVRAPQKGIIVGRAMLPVVNEGDALFHLADITSTEIAEGTMGALTSQLEQTPLFDEDEII